MKKTLVTSAYDLEHFLIDKCGGDLTTDSFATLMGGIVGTYKDEKIKITFGKNEYLLISSSMKGKELIEELVPILNEAMGSEEPICKYDLLSDGKTNEEDAAPTIEWDIKNPEERIKEVVNGRAFSDNPKCLNLFLYGDRKIASYIEDEKAKQDRIANARIYGIDPGCLKNPDEVNAMSEVDLYFMIDTLGGIIWSAKHAAKHDDVQPDLTEEQYALEYCVSQTRKFGVELPEPTIDKHISGTPSYTAWCNFYSNHFKKVLTDQEWRDYQQAKALEQDVSLFMPQGDWKDSLGESLTKKR